MNPILDYIKMLFSGQGAANVARGGMLGGPTPGPGSVPVPTEAPRGGMLGGAMGQPAPGATAQTAPQAQVVQPRNGSQPGNDISKVFGNILSKERGADLMAMGIGMLQGGAPSLDPKNGDFMSALGSGLGAAQASQGQRADTDLKRAVTQAQIGNYDSAAKQNLAQTELLNSQAQGNRDVSAIYANMNAGPAAPTAPTAAGGIPDAAAAALRSDPSRAAEFDAKYGAGSAARILGGA